MNRCSISSIEFEQLAWHHFFRSGLAASSPHVNWGQYRLQQRHKFLCSAITLALVLGILRRGQSCKSSTYECGHVQCPDPFLWDSRRSAAVSLIHQLCHYQLLMHFPSTCDTRYINIPGPLIQKQPTAHFQAIEQHWFICFVQNNHFGELPRFVSGWFYNKIFDSWIGSGCAIIHKVWLCELMRTEGYEFQRSNILIIDSFDR